MVLEFRGGRRLAQGWVQRVLQPGEIRRPRELLVGDGDFFHLAGLQQSFEVAVGEQLLRRTAEKALDRKHQERGADKVPKGKVLFRVHGVRRATAAL